MSRELTRRLARLESAAGERRGVRRAVSALPYDDDGLPPSEADRAAGEARPEMTEAEWEAQYCHEHQIH